MNITIGTNELTLTKNDGSTESISGSTINTVTAHFYKVYQPVTFDTATYQTSVPSVYDPSTNSFSNIGVSSTNQWIIRIQLNNLRYEDIVLGKTGGAAAAWANSSTGANTGVTAIKAIFP